MNKFLVFAAILGVTAAAPGLFRGDVDGHVSVTQSSIGTYKFNVDLKDSSKSEERFPDGSVVGEYTILDNGVPQTIRYTAGKEGYRIVSGPLPVVPVADFLGGYTVHTVRDTPEVQGAKEQFFKTYNSAGPLPVASVADFLGGYTAHTVRDTPEVQAAKEQFFKTYNSAGPLPVASVADFLGGYTAHTVRDTPEVQAAKEQFFRTYNSVLSHSS